jgi:hypothetical protein
VFTGCAAYRGLVPAERLQHLALEVTADGPEQQARDERMATGATDWAIKAVEWIYAHDARRPT